MLDLDGAGLQPAVGIVVRSAGWGNDIGKPDRLSSSDLSLIFLLTWTDASRARVPCLLTLVQAFDNGFFGYIALHWQTDTAAVIL